MHGSVDSTGLKRLVAVDASRPSVTETVPTELDAAAAVSRSSPQQPSLGDADHSPPTAMDSTDDRTRSPTQYPVLGQA